MARNALIAAIAVLLITGAAACKYERPSMWELKCAACHDGSTVLNGRVVPDREALKARYRDMAEFAGSCEQAPGCMNILKHDKGLFMDVGREIGIPEASSGN